LEVRTSTKNESDRIKKLRVLSKKNQTQDIKAVNRTLYGQSDWGCGHLQIRNKISCGKSRTGGRNNRGVITLKGRGGGGRRIVRAVDYKRLIRSSSKQTTTFNVVKIEHDPNRTAQIALLNCSEGSRSYILAPRYLKLGTTLCVGPTAPIEIGNTLPLSEVPLGSIVHNVELSIGHGGRIARAAGTYVQIIAKEGLYATVKLPSKEIRLIHSQSLCTLGQVGNVDIINNTLGKAGGKRWIGRRPKVRGVVKNPVDHPHGGGEGRSPIGRIRPVTPWGRPALGIKTRKTKNPSDRFILRPRG
jgi:large subunit ribosomal protein L2